MDPDANLHEQIYLAEIIKTVRVTQAEAERLAELVLALDAWIKGGGFLPKRWRDYE